LKLSASLPPPAAVVDEGEFLDDDLEIGGLLLFILIEKTWYIKYISVADIKVDYYEEYFLK
jgi:hypothetical protein